MLAKSSKNLYVMEIDPSNENDVSAQKELSDNTFSSFLDSLKNIFGEEDILSLIPGCDEAFAVLQVLQFVHKSNYKYFIFDTAPTGHTLRFLHLPLLLKKLVDKAVHFLSGNSGTGFIQQIGSLISPNIGSEIEKLGDQAKLLQEKLNILVEILKDNTQSQFICVAIPEQLSIYENERLMQKLDEDGITKVRNIIINRVNLFDNNDNCPTCSKQKSKQIENLKFIRDLYIDDPESEIYVHFVPLFDQEITGPDKLDKFCTLIRERTESDRIYQAIKE
ncbi:MAG: Golgi to ER traffic-related protein [Paramarteilia canceri]